jgi:hypothetical protein
MSQRNRPPREARAKLALADAVLRGDRDGANAAIRKLKQAEQERAEFAKRNAAVKVTAKP